MTTTHQLGAVRRAHETQGRHQAQRTAHAARALDRLTQAHVRRGKANSKGAGR
jgi:hypothetical protein